MHPSSSPCLLYGVLKLHAQWLQVLAFQNTRLAAFSGTSFVLMNSVQPHICAAVLCTSSGGGHDGLLCHGGHCDRGRDAV